VLHRLHYPCPHRSRWLMPAVLFVIGLGWQGAEASYASQVVAFDGDDHAHLCKCGMRCQGGSCCCRPSESKAAKSSRTKAVGTGRADDGPCLNSAPCSEPMLPSVSSFGHISKAASNAMCLHLSPIAVGRLFAPNSRCVLPVRRASRLDDPPESLPVA
jgi:hypothetical protein